MFIISVSAVVAPQGHPLSDIMNGETPLTLGGLLTAQVGITSSTFVNANTITATGKVTAGSIDVNGVLDMKTNKITNLATPTSSSPDTDAATKGYVNDQIVAYVAANPVVSIWSLDAGNNIYLTDNTQFVGIGTSSPAYRLHVYNGDLNVQNGKILITSVNSGELLKIQKSSSDILKVTDSKITMSKDIEYSGTLTNTKGFWNGAKWIAEGWNKECTTNGGGSGQHDITGILKVNNGKLEYRVTKGTAVETGVWEGLAKTLYACVGSTCGHENWAYWSGIGLSSAPSIVDIAHNALVYSSAPSLILISANGNTIHYCAITVGVDAITSG